MASFLFTEIILMKNKLDQAKNGYPEGVLAFVIIAENDPLQPRTTNRTIQSCINASVARSKNQPNAL
jgi:hypothetical protein